MTRDLHHEAREAARHDMLQDFVQRGLVPKPRHRRSIPKASKDGGSPKMQCQRWRRWIGEVSHGWFRRGALVVTID